MVCAVFVESVSHLLLRTAYGSLPCQFGGRRCLASQAHGLHGKPAASLLRPVRSELLLSYRHIMFL